MKTKIMTDFTSEIVFFLHEVNRRLERFTCSRCDMCFYSARWSVYDRAFIAEPLFSKERRKLARCSAHCTRCILIRCEIHTAAVQITNRHVSIPSKWIFHKHVIVGMWELHAFDLLFFKGFFQLLHIYGKCVAPPLPHKILIHVEFISSIALQHTTMHTTVWHRRMLSSISIQINDTIVTLQQPMSEEKQKKKRIYTQHIFFSSDI